MSQRIQRVNELIKQQISQLLLKEIDFGDILVTVTDVDTSADLRQAKVKIIILPNEKSEEVLKIIKRKIFYLQQILNKKLNFKTVPKIIFEIDRTEEKAQRIEELLNKIKKG
jgi:ribosome-binding factor A